MRATFYFTSPTFPSESVGLGVAIESHPDLHG
jgi:hypothetical protein